MGYLEVRRPLDEVFDHKGMASARVRVDPRRWRMTMHPQGVRCRQAADLLFDGGDLSGVKQFEHDPVRSVDVGLGSRQPFLRGIR